MKNIRISPKFIELVKTNSKRLLCGVITFIALAIPHTGKTESKSEDIQVNERIVEQLNYYNNEEVEFIVDGESVKVTLDLSNPELAKAEIKEILDSLNALRPASEFPSFFLISHWEKSENYDEVKKESDDKREYKRTITCFRTTDNYENDIEKIATKFRDDSDNEKYTIVGTREEYVVVTPEEEEKLETSKDTVMFEGSNIVFKVDKKEERRHTSSLAVIIINSFNMARLLAKKRDE